MHYFAAFLVIVVGGFIPVPPRWQYLVGFLVGMTVGGLIFTVPNTRG